VNVYYLFGENTVDDFIYPSLRFKSDVTSKILDDKRADFEMEKKSQNEGMEGVKENAQKEKDLESADTQNKVTQSQKKIRKRSRAEINREESYSARRITDFLQPKSQQISEEEISSSGNKEESIKSQPKDWNEEDNSPREADKVVVDKEQIERESLMRSINQEKVDEDEEDEGNEREARTPVSNIDEMVWGQELDRQDIGMDEEFEEVDYPLEGEVDYPLQGDFEVDGPLKGKFGVDFEDDPKDEFLDDPDDGPIENVEEDEDEDEEHKNIEPKSPVKEETVFDKEEEKNEQDDDAFQDDFMRFLMRKDIAKVSCPKTPPRSPSPVRLPLNEEPEKIEPSNPPAEVLGSKIEDDELDDDELDAAFENIDFSQATRTANNEKVLKEKNDQKLLKIQENEEDVRMGVSTQTKGTQIIQAETIRVFEEIQKPQGTEIGGFKLKINGGLANNTKSKDPGISNKEGDLPLKKKMRYSEKFGEEEGKKSEPRKKVKFE